MGQRALTGNRLQAVTRFIGLVAALLLPGAPLALAQADNAAAAYVTERGFAARDVAPIKRTLQGIIGKNVDKDVSPTEQALLLLEALEPALPRVRYMLRYSEVKAGEITVALVDLRRYNLGPTIRNETIREYGADNTAGPGAFGVGPHAGWRFVFERDTGGTTSLMAAGRREFTNAEAAKRDCLVRKCLDLDLLDDFADWTELAKSVGEAAPPYSTRSKVRFGDEFADDYAPAYIALKLADAIGMITSRNGQMLWTVEQRQGPATDEPLFAIVIDRNLGQEIFTDAALGVPILGKFDREHWVRSVGGPDGQTYLTAAGPLRRGGNR